MMDLFDYKVEAAGMEAVPMIPATDPNQPPRTLHLMQLETPLGAMMAGAVAEGISLLTFMDGPGGEAAVTKLAKEVNATLVHDSHPHLTLLQQELGAYFEGTLQEFTVPLFTPGTPFQQQVWASLRRIPYGHTHSYGRQALALGKPSAVRAVAAANGMNRIAILIPCHRVIGGNGSLTGYSGGLWRKQWLLRREIG